MISAFNIGDYQNMPFLSSYGRAKRSGHGAVRDLFATHTQDA
jgi:hypothetical protein